MLYSVGRLSVCLSVCLYFRSAPAATHSTSSHSLTHSLSQCVQCNVWSGGHDGPCYWSQCSTRKYYHNRQLTAFKPRRRVSRQAPLCVSRFTGVPVARVWGQKSPAGSLQGHSPGRGLGTKPPEADDKTDHRTPITTIVREI